MALKIFRGTTPGQRFRTALIYDEVTKSRPERSLIVKLNRISGHSLGKVTQKGKGGGHKRNLRVIDFKRNKRDIEALVAAIEYDPNRTANIALLHYKDGEKKYILSPQGLKVGDKVISSDSAPIKPGNALPLGKIPTGTLVHNIELTPSSGAQAVRSAGTAAIVAAKEGKWVHIKMPSKEVRKVNAACLATIGQIGNLDWKNTTIGKAGRSRHMGIKPKVRGVAQDPRSHPHGGGEAKSGIGMKYPKTKSGRPVPKGKKTRNKNKPSGKYILERRRK